MKSGIYKIVNSKNGKFYIGSTKNISVRWNEHKSDLRRGNHPNPKLQHAWDFYGESSFFFEIVELTKSKPKLLFEREQHYLETLKPFSRTVGYNICPTAEGGDTFTHNPRKEEIREYWKIHSIGEENPMFGKKHSKETVRDMKEKSVGRYTLGWFVGRYGKREGKKKFVARRQSLKNRQINYSYDNKLIGTKRGPMSDDVKRRISEKKLLMRKIRQDLHKDILSEKFTILQLTLKYSISKTTILRERRKLTQ